MTTMQQQYDNAARAIAQEGRLSPDVSAAALFAYVDSVPGHREALGTVLAAQMRAAQGGGGPIDPTPETRRIGTEMQMLSALTVLERHKDDAEHWERLTPKADSITDLGQMIATAREAFADNLAEVPALLAAHRALRPRHPSDGPQDVREAAAMICTVVGQRWHGTQMEDACDECAAAIRTMELPPSGWQPIETAPNAWLLWVPGALVSYLHRTRGAAEMQLSALPRNSGWTLSEVHTRSPAPPETTP